MESGPSFNSKLLLFGEYGLMFNAMALSVPFPEYSGWLVFDPEGRHQESNAEIRKFYNFLETGIHGQNLHFSFDLEQLAKDLEHGLYFESNIPQGYGVGQFGRFGGRTFQ